MKRYSVRTKKQNRDKTKLVGKKIVMILVIISLSFSMVSWQNFFNIFAAVATYGRTDDGAWNYKILNTSSRTVSIRPADLGELESSTVDIPSDVVIQGESYTVAEIAAYAYAQCFCSDCLKGNRMSLSTAWEDYGQNYTGEEVEIEINELVIPATVTVIGESAFEYCILNKITFQEISNLTTIEEYAFADCSLETIEIPSSVTTIESFAFSYSAIKTVIFEEGSNLEEIAEYTFVESSLKEIFLPESVTKIGEAAFLACRLVTITIPASITTIDASAFEENTKLKEIKFAEDGALKNISIGAFMGCKLIEVTIPESVTTVGICAFGNNNDLETVTFQKASAIEGLDSNAFAQIERYAYGEDEIDKMDYERNTSVSQVNVKNYDVYKWVAASGMFDDSAKIYSANTRVFLEEQKDENVIDNVAMGADKHATIHLNDYISENQGYHFEGSKFEYSEKLSLEQANTGDIERTNFISYGYPYVVLKANQKANEYEIDYYTYEGGTSMVRTKCQYNQAITISSHIPTRIGYEFMGWSKSASGEGTLYQPGAVINENFTDEDGAVVTLYAVWKEITKKVTISFSTPKNISADYGFEIIVTKNGATIQQHDVGSDQVGAKQLVIYGAKVGETYVIKCTNYEKENGKKKYFQTTTKEVTIK